MLRHDSAERRGPLEKALDRIPPDLTNAANQILLNAQLKGHIPRQDTYNNFALIDEHVACMLRLDVGSEKYIERWNAFSVALATGSRPGALGELRNWPDYFFSPFFLSLDCIFLITRALTPTQALFNPYFQILDVREDRNKKGEATGKMLLSIVFFIDKVSFALHKYNDGEYALLPSLKKKTKNNN